MLKNFRFLLELLITLLNKLYSNTLDTKGMSIVKVEYHNKGRFKTFTITNPGLTEGKELLQALFVTLNKDARFVNFCENKFITITLSSEFGTFTFKDSLRIFPMSLSGLCKTFGVEGKLSKYNPDFNKPTLFDNKSLLDTFISYGLQDSVALYNALVNAQAKIYNDFKLDITSRIIVSTSSLAFNVFRSKFLKVEIPILNNAQDSFIRRGYFGGATDYYKKYVTNAKYYDVNSLYPFAMLNDMPGKMVKYHNNLSGFDLYSFFGFALAEVHIPNTLVPLLPYKSKEDRTIFPTGKVIGVYFSEELKALANRGYSITLIRGYEFERVKDLFTDFINHFYELKKFAKGSERALAKLIMNSSYGNFGRKSELLVTRNVHRDELDVYVLTSLVKNIIRINDDWRTVLMVNNLPTNIIKTLNLELDADIVNFESVVKANVSIAAAITAYARIHMMDFKLNNDVIYSDTDSVILGNTIDDSLIGPELGQMKDELVGGYMNECYVLGIKQYGYHYTSEKGRTECSIFAGVARNSISFLDFKDLANGSSLYRKLPNRFNRAIRSLSITIKPAEITVKANTSKQLVGNNYVPPHIVDLNHELDNRSRISKLIRKYKHFLRLFVG